MIRAQEGSENLYASIDLVSDKIARQLRKYKVLKTESSLGKTRLLFVTLRNWLFRPSIALVVK